MKYILANLRGWRALEGGYSWSGRERNRCFLNLRSGEFADVSAASGLDFVDDGRAAAKVDWDFDGDLDLWLANRTGPRIRFVQNDTSRDGHFLSVFLVGQTCNRDAIGARVEVHVGGAMRRTLIQTLRAGEGFLAQSSKWIHFGLGSDDAVEKLVVRWPDNQTEEFKVPAVDCCYRIAQHSRRLVSWTPPQRRRPLVAQQRSAPPISAAARILISAPKRIPRLSYENPAGTETIEIDQQQRRPLLLNLWSASCAPCLAEIQDLTRRASDLRERGIQVLAVQVEAADESLHQAADRETIVGRLLEFGFEVGTGGRAFLQQIDRTLKSRLAKHQELTLPTSLLLNKDSELVAVYKGPIDVDTLLTDVESLGLDRQEFLHRALPHPGRWFVQP